jgi:phosphonate transport system substrate-binding protein
MKSLFGKKMRLNNRLLLLFAFSAFAFLALIAGINMLDLEFDSNPIKTSAPQPVKKSGKEYFIGVVSRYAPSLLYKGYQPVIDYLNRTTPYRFSLKLSSSYEEAVKQLAEGKTVAAFLGTFVLAKNLREYDLHAFLAPRNKSGAPLFQVVLVTREDSPIDSAAQLANRRVGTPSKMSLSANWLQSILSEDIVNSITFVNYDFHHTVIQHIIRGDIAAGVVKDRVAGEYLGRGIKIIRKSALFPASPLVSGPQSSSRIINAIETALSSAPGPAAGGENNWDPEFKNGFVAVTNEPYLRIGKRFFFNREK